MRLSTWVLLCLFLSLLVGCHYYQDYRQKKGDADVTEERANLMKTYRECLEKYEGNSTEIRERCAVYRSMLDKIDAEPMTR
jgi:hypothetical protein